MGRKLKLFTDVKNICTATKGVIMDILLTILTKKIKNHHPLSINIPFPCDSVTLSFTNCLPPKTIPAGGT